MKKNEEVNVDYWDNGNKKVETHFKNGKPDGLTTGWYESGKKKGETRYKNGKPEGLFTLWYESGVKGVEGHYKNGKKEGLQTAWYESGEFWLAIGIVSGVLITVSAGHAISEVGK